MSLKETPYMDLFQTYIYVTRLLKVYKEIEIDDYCYHNSILTALSTVSSIFKEGSVPGNLDSRALFLYTPRDRLSKEPRMREK